MTLFSNDAAQRPNRSIYKNELTVYENHNSTEVYYYNITSRSKRKQINLYNNSIATVYYYNANSSVLLTN